MWVLILRGFRGVLNQVQNDNFQVKTAVFWSKCQLDFQNERFPIRIADFSSE
jgi:hypothetical protein